MDLLDRLLGHDQWATDQLLDLSRSLTDAQLDQPFDVGHRTLRATFEHIIINIAFWTALMTERPVDTQQYDRSLAGLVERHERYYATFATLARQLRDEQRLDDTFIDHYAARKSFRRHDPPRRPPQRGAPDGGGAYPGTPRAARSDRSRSWALGL